jgi:hypothetical protein
MPLIALDPPSSFPRGTGMRRPLVLGSGSELYSQLAAGLVISRAEPTGRRRPGIIRDARFEQQHLVVRIRPTVGRRRRRRPSRRRRR